MNGCHFLLASIVAGHFTMLASIGAAQTPRAAAPAAPPQGTTSVTAGPPISGMCVFSESGRSMDFVATRVGEFSFLADVEPSDSHKERRSKVAMRVEVQTITLNDLLLEAEAPRQIDYLSVDTEGSELEILSAFDFDRWDVRAISVEHNKTPARQGIYELLVRNGYRRQWPEFSRFDDWYVRD